MLIGNKIPFVKDQYNMKNCIKKYYKKGLGTLIVKNNLIILQEY